MKLFNYSPVASWLSIIYVCVIFMYTYNVWHLFTNCSAANRARSESRRHTGEARAQACDWSLLRVLSAHAQYDTCHMTCVNKAPLQIRCTCSRTSNSYLAEEKMQRALFLLAVVAVATAFDFPECWEAWKNVSISSTLIIIRGIYNTVLLQTLSIPST